MANFFSALFLLLMTGHQLFAQPVSKNFHLLPASINLDGNLTPNEWSSKIRVRQYNFDFGTLYYQVLNDTLFLGFDLTTDMGDDRGGDKLSIDIDLNRNKMTDEAYRIYSGDNMPAQPVLILQNPARATAKSKYRNIDIKVASYFGLSAFMDRYAHRSWEAAVPISQLMWDTSIGLAFTVQSITPLFNKTVGKTSDGYFSAELVIAKSGINFTDAAVTLPVTATSSMAEDKAVVSKKINADGNVEITYSDQSRKILYNGGYKIVFPDGRTSTASFMQTPAFVPPALPNDANIGQFLQNVNNALLDQISVLLNHDAPSMANFQSGDASLNIYQSINRHFKFLDFLTTK